jgi:peptide-methionine (S)-S-oxide reductase
VFVAKHDPTQLNRQGPDVGTQYRSVIFHHDEAQAQAAGAARKLYRLPGRYRRPAVTEIVPFSNFFRAKEYHQRYREKRGLASCTAPLPALCIKASVPAQDTACAGARLPVALHSA